MDSRPPLIRLAVFGRPIAHSLSPQIHRRFAHQLGLEIDYRAIEATADSFPNEVRALLDRGGRGCNVTVPLKGDAWRLAAECSASAARAQAANTLVFDGEIFAENTDGQGLVNDLLDQPGFRLAGSRICVLGAGGAAAGILASLLQGRPERLVLANRTVERALALAKRHADLGRIEACSPADIRQWAPFDLVVNATSLGHGGDAPPLSAVWLSPAGLCYDLNYGTAAQPLESLCRDLGVSYTDGLGMLVHQAALSFELWTGERPDPAPVLDSLRA